MKGILEENVRLKQKLEEKDHKLILQKKKDVNKDEAVVDIIYYKKSIESLLLSLSDKDNGNAKNIALKNTVDDTTSI